MSKQQPEFLGYESEPVPEPVLKENQALLAYWQDKRLPGKPLARSALDPSDIVALLPGIFMAEPEGETYRFRLVGSEMETRMKRRPTGKTLEEVYGTEFGGTAKQMYRDVVGQCAPLCLHGNFLGDNLEHIKVEAIVLPMEFNDGGQGILGGLFDFSS